MSDNIRAAPGTQSDPSVSTDEVTINGVLVHVPHTRLLLGDRAVDGGFWSATNPAAVKFVSAQHVIVDSGALTATVDTSLLATQAKQDTGNTALATIAAAHDAALSTLATQATLAALNTKIPSSPATDRATAGAPFAVRLSDGTSFISTLPVSLASLPSLATGSNVIGAVTQSGSWTAAVSSLPSLPTGSNTIGAVTFAGAQPVTQSGTWTTGVNAGAKIGTVPVVGTTVRSGGFVKSLVAKTSACYPCTARIHNSSASAGYGMIFNASSLPADGAVPDAVVTVASNNGASFLNIPPIPTDGWGTGFVIALSTTQTTLTLIGTNSALIEAHFFPAQA